MCASVQASGYSPVFDFASKKYCWGQRESARMERERLVLLKNNIETDRCTPGSLLLVSHGSASSSMTAMMVGEKDRWSVSGVDGA